MFQKLCEGPVYGFCRLGLLWASPSLIPCLTQTPQLRVISEFITSRRCYLSRLYQWLSQIPTDIEVSISTTDFASLFYKDQNRKLTPDQAMTSIRIWMKPLILFYRLIHFFFLNRHLLSTSYVQNIILCASDIKINEDVNLMRETGAGNRMRIRCYCMVLASDLPSLAWLI